MERPGLVSVPRRKHRPYYTGAMSNTHAHARPRVESINVP